MIMMIKKQSCLLIAALVSLALSMHGCVNLQPGSTSNIRTTAPATSAAASLQPTATPSQALPTASPAPVESVTYVTNAYSASDGKYVYYYTENDIHRMELDGSNDQSVINMYGFYEFLGFDASGLYYLAYDTEYVPTQYEQDNWQFVIAFNLVKYDLQTQTSTTLQTHLLNATWTASRIYMFDHMDHARILSYEQPTGSVADVTGLPEGISDIDNMYITIDAGNPYLNVSIGEEAHAYLIDGNRIDTTVELPNSGTGEDMSTFSMAVNGIKLQINYETGTAAVWVGDAIKDLGLSDPYDILGDGQNAYILTMKVGTEDADGKADATIALYSVTAAGTATKVFEGPSITYRNEGGDIFEMAGGWLFSFWAEGDGGTVSQLLLKHKVN
jgi:hypothetical protein